MLKKFNEMTTKVGDRVLVMVILSLLSLFVLVAYVLMALYADLGNDAGYYLGCVELIYKGKIPYKDFSLGYTPLALYVLLIPRCITSSCVVTLLFHVLIVFADAFLLAVCVRKITNKYLFAWLLGLVFLILVFHLEGTYLYLEPYSILFGESAMLFVMSAIDAKTIRRQNIYLLLSGVFVAFAFLSKQYGIVFAAFVGIVVLLSSEEWKRKILDCLLLFLGFCIPILLGVSYFRLNGLDLSALFAQLTGKGYGAQTLGMYISGVTRMIRLFPWILIVPVFLFINNNWENGVFWACLISMFFASLQFYFNTWDHYFLYLLPFLFVLASIIWKDLWKHKTITLLFLVFYGLYFTSAIIPLQQLYTKLEIYVENKPREDEMRIAESLNRLKQQYGIRKALVFNIEEQYYWCSFEPALMKKYGFSFGKAVETDEIMSERLEDADCFIASKSGMESAMGWIGFNRILSKSFAPVIDSDSENICVFVKKKLVY